MAEVEPEPEPEIQQNSGSQPAGEKSLSRFIASEDCSKRKQMCITVAVSGSILVVLILIFSIKNIIEDNNGSNHFDE